MIRRSLALLAVLFLALSSAACGGSEASAEEFCALGSDLDAGVTDADKDPAKAMDEVTGVLDEAKDKAPKEIKDDVEVLADAFAELSENTKDLDFADPEDSQALQKASADLDSEAVEKAGTNVTKWVEDNCEDGKVKK